MQYDAKTPVEYFDMLAIGDTRIAEFIAKAMSMWRKGQDFSC